MLPIRRARTFVPDPSIKIGADLKTPSAAGLKCSLNILRHSLRRRPKRRLRPLDQLPQLINRYMQFVDFIAQNHKHPPLKLLLVRHDLPHGLKNPARAWCQFGSMHPSFEDTPGLFQMKFPARETASTSTSPRSAIVWVPAPALRSYLKSNLRIGPDRTLRVAPVAEPAEAEGRLPIGFPGAFRQTIGADNTME
jgi:hypothetical protein